MNGICPVCNEETETPLHLLTCDCEKKNEVWGDVIEKLRNGLEQIGMDDVIAETFVSFVSKRDEQTMRESMPPYDWLHDDELYKMIEVATVKQDELGWKLFVEGKVIKGWAHIQEHHY